MSAAEAMSFFFLSFFSIIIIILQGENVTSLMLFDLQAQEN